MIREFDINNGTLSTIVGNGVEGYVNSGHLTSEFNSPTGIEADLITTVITGGSRQYGDVIYISDASNFVTRYFCAGSFPNGSSRCPPNIQQVATYSGNHAKGYVNGPAGTAEFAHLGGIHGIIGYAIDSENHTIRTLGANVGTFAGNGTPGFVNGYRTSAKFAYPTQLTLDASSNIYVADAGNHVIRKINTSGTVSTFAGSGTSGYKDGSSTVARFVWPTSVVFNAADNYFYVADPMNNTIRRIDQSGNVSTYSGAPAAGYVNGSLSQARYSGPSELVIANGIMYVSDSTNNAIRRIDMTTGVVSTYIN